MTEISSDKLRRWLLGLFIVGASGLSAELLLLEHYEEWRQWLPLGFLVASVPLASWVAWRPGRVSVNAFLTLGALMVVVGALGVFFHLSGNVEFELELNPELSGSALLWDTVRGATPVLAPGAMVQLGLLGVIAAWRHPGAKIPARS